MAIEIELKVRWGDMDALGHVNNTVFFRWFEEVRIATFADVGIAATSPSAVGPILARTTCDFLAPVHFPATVHVRCTIGRLGTTSFTMHYEAFVDSAPVARGEGVVVLVDYGSGSKVAIDDALRAGLNRHAA